MKKFTILFITLVLTTIQAWATPVSASTAQTMAQDFWQNSTGFNPGSIPNSGGANPVLLYTQASGVNPMQNAYYIYNTSNGFVIVAGDDRAESILAYGDEQLDMEDIPIAMQYMLDSYKEQIDFLLEHPDLMVETPMMNAPMLTASSISPMLTANWGQGDPYNRQTPKYNGTNCKAGCSCVSLSQVMFYWKHPTTAVPNVPAYTTTTLGISVPELVSTTFDWSNMKNSYSSFSTAQANAVAQLMRYVGQAEEMDYTPNSSRAAVFRIERAAKLFGYDRNADVVYRSDFTDAQWNAMIQAELSAGRPVIMAGWSADASVGHAFNIDGYNASTKKYHINWGWKGSSNGYYALNAFNPSTYDFNHVQHMIVGLKPQMPELEVAPASLSFNAVTGGTKTSSFRVTGYGLTGKVTLKLNNGGTIYSLSKTSITKEEAAAGEWIYVTYKPTEAGTSSASITISSSGAESKTVNLSGTAIKPEIMVYPSSLSFNAVTGETKTSTFRVSGTDLTDDLSLSVSGADIYSINKTIITKSSASSGATVTVTYKPTAAGSTSAKVTISGGGADPKTVTLSGTAVAPTITVKPATLSFTGVPGKSVTKTFKVTGTDLKSNLSLTLKNGGGIYSIDKTQITKDEASSGANVTVTYRPRADGTSSASIIVSGGGAEAKTVTLSGTAATPTMTVSPTSLAFSGVTGKTMSKTFRVTGTNLTSDLTVTLNNGGGIYSISKTVIPKDDAPMGAIVRVTYKPTVAGSSSASITVSGNDIEPQTVALSGEAVTPVITVDPSSLSLSAYVGETKTATFTVTGTDLTGDLTITQRGGNDIFLIDKTTISRSEATVGATVTVTYHPTNGGSILSNIDVSGGDAETQTVTLNGNATSSKIIVEPDSLSFFSYVNNKVKQKIKIRGYDVEKDYTFEFSDTTGTFKKGTSNTTIIGSNFISEVEVVYDPKVAGTSNAVLTVHCGAAKPQTVFLSGEAMAFPDIEVDVNSVSFDATYTGFQSSRKLTVTCPDLASDLRLDVTRDFYGSFGLSKQTITPEAAAAGAEVTVYFGPDRGGNLSAMIRFSYDGYEAFSIPVSGFAIQSTGYITGWPSSLSFETEAGVPVTKTFRVTYSDPDGAVMLSSAGGDAGPEAQSNRREFMQPLDGADDASLNSLLDSITWGPIDWDLIDDPFKTKTLMLEFTGDDCFIISDSNVYVTNSHRTDTITVTYYPQGVGVHDASIKITCTTGSVRPFHVFMHGTATEPTWIRGDVSGDGTISIRDVTLLIEWLLGDELLPASADVNEDDEVTIKDVTTLIGLILDH